MAESQGALPAAQVLTKEESAEGTKTAFQKNKALFYSLRILRELVPSLTIAVSVATFFTAIFTDFMQDSYGMRLMSPVKSSALDKIIAHYMIISRPDERYRPEAMHVYGPDWTRMGSDDWKDAAPDHWWCLKFQPHQRLAVHELNGTCLTPAWLGGVNDLCHNGYFAASGRAKFLGFDHFPSGDPGFGCVTPGMSNFPTVAQTDGDCYSMCIDVVGETPWAKAWIPLDLYPIILVPFYIDLFFIMGQIWKATLFEGYWQDIPLSRRLRYLLVSLLCYGLALFSWITGFGLKHIFWRDGVVTGVLFCLCGNFFFGLAAESTSNPFGKFIRFFVWPFYKFFMWSVDVKTPEDTKAKWDICTGEALCFYLVEAYKTKCAGAGCRMTGGGRACAPRSCSVGVVCSSCRCVGALRVRRAVWLKRVAIFLCFLVLVPWAMSYIPSHDAHGRLIINKSEFIWSQIPTILLLTMSIFTALQAPKFHVRACARHKPSCALPRGIMRA